MSASTILDRPDAGLLEWLAGHDVDFEIHEHEPTFTARTTASAERVDPRTFAKVVGVSTHDGRKILVVLEATDHPDIRKARRALDTTDVRLLTEAELAVLAPSCDVGAIPAVGALFGLATLADYNVRDDAEISFNAGSHRFSVRVERARWEQSCGVVYANLAAESDSRPAWSRS